MGKKLEATGSAEVPLIIPPEDHRRGGFHTSLRGGCDLSKVAASETAEKELHTGTQPPLTTVWGGRGEGAKRLHAGRRLRRAGRGVANGWIPQKARSVVAVPRQRRMHTDAAEEAGVAGEGEE